MRAAATTTTPVGAWSGSAGIKPLIARHQTEHGSGVGRHRWVAERTLAWLHNRRRLLVRTDPARKGGNRNLPD